MEHFYRQVKLGFNIATRTRWYLDFLDQVLNFKGMTIGILHDRKESLELQLHQDEPITFQNFLHLRVYNPELHHGGI
jgi:hypothetical protein